MSEPTDQRQTRTSIRFDDLVPAVRRALHAAVPGEIHVSEGDRRGETSFTLDHSELSWIGTIKVVRATERLTDLCWDRLIDSEVDDPSAEEREYIYTQMRDVRAGDLRESSDLIRAKQRAFRLQREHFQTSIIRRFLERLMQHLTAISQDEAMLLVREAQGTLLSHSTIDVPSTAQAPAQTSILAIAPPPPDRTSSEPPVPPPQPVTDPTDQRILAWVTDDPDLKDSEIAQRLIGPTGEPLSRQAVSVRRNRLKAMGYKVR